MATFLHAMVRITDPQKSRGVYEALGFRFARDMDIVRNGELEATNYFFSLGDADNVLELTYNHDDRTYDLGTGYGHIAIGVDDLDATLTELAAQGIEPSASRTRSPKRIAAEVPEPTGERYDAARMAAVDR
jgi:lactoylglutathione lyase